MRDFLYGQCLKGARRTENTIDLKFSLLDPSLLSFKASSLRSPPPPPPPRVPSVYRYRGDTFLCDGLRHFQYFQAVTLQQDQEVARWLIFSVIQAARAVSET